MNRIQELFYQRIKNDKRFGIGESSGTLKAWANCEKAISHMPEEVQVGVSDIISTYGAEREELGFVNGFRYGAEIIFDVLKGGDSI